MKKYLSLVGTALLSCILILFFAAYGENNKWISAFGNAWKLVKDTVLGIHLRANYYGVGGVAFLYSIRLIVFAVVISLLLGSVLSLVRVRARTWLKALIDVPFTIIESVPEPIYIVFVVLLLLFFLEHTTWQLPAFPEAAPSFIDTVIPAIALGLPGAFYLSRILQLSLQDELNAQYVTTALSKGLTQSQTFYRHVLANVVPGFIKQISVVCAIVLSSVVFAEYMLSYQGALFHFVEYGFLHTQRLRGIPAYEPGLDAMVGVFLVGVWLLFTLLGRLLYDIRFPRDIETNPTVQTLKYQLPWILTGVVLIAIVIILSIFPHLLDKHSPYQQFLVNWRTLTSAPFPPSRQFPMGTDYLGRDLLARTLAGTKDTLVPAVIITLVTVVLSLTLSSLSTVHPKNVLSRTAKGFGNMLAALPVLVILMIVMRERNFASPYQAIVYVTWIVLFETGRGVNSFVQVYDQWYQYGFVEGAISVGRSRIAILFVHLRKWLQRYTLEFAFLEFSRVLSLMTMLAVFQVYTVESMGYPEFYQSPVPVVVSAHNTWLSMIGDAVLNGAFMNQEWFFYAPVLCLLLVTVGSNLIARGLRGKASN